MLYGNYALSAICIVNYSIIARHLTLVVCFAFFQAWISSPALSFNVHPMKHVIKTNDSNLSNINVSNTSSDTLTLDVKVNRLIGVVNGSFQIESSEENFLIFPQTMIIRPGSSQVVQVQWLGDPSIRSSETYLVNISQVPVALPGEVDQGLQVSLAFNVVFHIIPEDAQPNLVLTGKELTALETGEPALKLELSNDGTRFAHVSDAEISISGGGYNLHLTPLDIKEKQLDTIILPGTTQHINIPLGDKDFGDSVEVLLGAMKDGK